MKKKYQKLYGLLLLLLSMLLLENSSIASEHFNFTSGDIQNFYTIMRDNSLWYSSENDTNYHNIVVNRWTSGDEIINNLSDNDWATIETMVNDFLEQYWITSGEYYDIYGYNEYGMNDSMVWILVSPAPRTTDSAQINILFIPYVTGELVGLENRATISGDYAYHTTINAYNYNMDGTALGTSQTNALVSLQLKSDGTYGMYTNRSNWQATYSVNVSRALSNIHYWYRRDLPNPYYENNNIVYYIGLLKTTRNNNYSQLDGAKMWQYKGYNFYNYKNVYNGFTYNLDNRQIISGDATTPTPTPQPTSSEGTGGITKEEMTKAIGSYWGNENDISGEKQEGEIQQGINNITNEISGEIANIEAYKMIELAEGKFYDIFQNPQDFRIYWNDVIYQNKKIIEAGEINFSQMEREIPTIALIMTYIRTILGFIITMNIIKTIWNIIMDMLGIKEAKEEYENEDAYNTIEASKQIIKIER